MQFTCNTQALRTAVLAAMRSINEKSRIPILTCLKLIAGDEHVHVAGTDLDISTEIAVSATIEEVGVAILPAAKLAGVLADTGVVHVESIKDGAIIRNGRSRYKLPGLSPADFPDPPGLSENIATITPTPDDIAALKCIAAIVPHPKDEPRTYICGVHFHSAAGKLVMAATDGVILARAATAIDCPPLAITVPGKTVGEIIRIGAKDGLTLRCDGARIEATTGPVKLVSKLIAEKFPDYARLIPAPAAAAVVVDSSALAAALGRLSAISDKTSNATTITWDSDTAPGDVELRLSRRIDSEGSDIITGETAGKDGPTVSAHRLIDLLDAFDAKRVRVSTHNSHGPILIEHIDKPNMIAVISPMRP